MTSPLKLLSLLSDPTRLRILSVLSRQELSVAELQEVLNLGQSRISTHLSQLKSADLLTTRRDGQRSFYQLRTKLSAKTSDLLETALSASAEIPECADDERALELAIRRRRERTQEYFNRIAGRLGKNYCPGRSWEAMVHLLLQLAPPMTIADLGAGEGMLSQLLASRAERVIAVDNSPQMVEVGSQLIKKNGIKNLEYRLGDIEEPPIEANSVDLAILSQALHHASQPEKAVAAAYKILKKGGQLLIMDLNKHSFEKARELYADTWLGFTEIELDGFLQDAGFKEISVSLVTTEKEKPHFQTLLANARKTSNKK